MLFRKEIESHCEYCTHGTKISDSEVMCIKRGIVTPDFHCRSFHYEPLKRTPPKPARLNTANLSPEDFSL